jgi:hypothetical protein
VDVIAMQRASSWCIFGATWKGPAQAEAVGMATGTGQLNFPVIFDKINDGHTRQVL